MWLRNWLLTEQPRFRGPWPFITDWSNNAMHNTEQCRIFWNTSAALLHFSIRMCFYNTTLDFSSILMGNLLMFCRWSWTALLTNHLNLKLYLSDGITTMEPYAFQGLQSLTKVDIIKFLYSDSFSGCRARGQQCYLVSQWKKFQHIKLYWLHIQSQTCSWVAVSWVNWPKALSLAWLSVLTSLLSCLGTSSHLPEHTQTHTGIIWQLFAYHNKLLWSLLKFLK